MAFGSQPATAVTFLSPTTLEATAPAGTGTVDVRVTTAHGTSAATAADDYRYVGPPTVSPALSPATGPGDGGVLVTVSGSGFAEGTPLVQFGDLPPIPATVLSGTQLVVRTPAGGGADGVVVFNDIGRVDRGSLVDLHLRPWVRIVTAIAGGDGDRAVHLHVPRHGHPDPDLRARAGAPAWLAINATTGAVSGTPPAATLSFSYAVVATNARARPPPGRSWCRCTASSPSPPRGQLRHRGHARRRGLDGG